MGKDSEETFLKKEDMANKHMKSRSTSLVTGEMQIKTILRHHFIPTRMSK